MNGKGDSYRPVNTATYNSEYERIFPGCKVCGARPLKAKGLCRVHYDKARKPAPTLCSNCGRQLRNRSVHRGFTECSTCRDRTAEKRAERKLHSRYGITPATRDSMLAEQGGVCPVCGRNNDLVVDHDHDTGVVRGLLCRRCNAGLGQFGDDPRLLRNAVTYLAGRKEEEKTWPCQ